MIIDHITYMAKGDAAGNDDIITLRLKLFDSSGRLVDERMISGHSILLSNSVVFFEPVEVESIEIEATDLDYEGHTLIFNDYEYAFPRTGSVTRSFKIAPLGAPEVSALEAVVVKSQGFIVEEPTIESFATAMRLPAPGEVAKAAGAGAGIALAVVAIIALIAFGRKKK